MSDGEEGTKYNTVHTTQVTIKIRAKARYLFLRARARCARQVLICSRQTLHNISSCLAKRRNDFSAESEAPDVEK